MAQHTEHISLPDFKALGGDDLKDGERATFTGIITRLDGQRQADFLIVDGFGMERRRQLDVYNWGVIDDVDAESPITAEAVPVAHDRRELGRFAAYGAQRRQRGPLRSQQEIRAIIDEAARKPRQVRIDPAEEARRAPQGAEAVAAYLALRGISASTVRRQRQAELPDLAAC